MEKELEKSWGKMGDRRAKTTTELLAGGDKEEEEMAAGLIRRKKYDYGRQRRCEDSVMS